MAVTDELEDFSAEEIEAELASREAAARGEAPAPRGDDALDSIDTGTLTRILREKQKVIYGVDDRLDVFQVSDQDLLDDADGVVALFPATSVIDNGDDTSTLLTVQFGAANNLCSGEPFFDQPLGPNCSGYLVESDVVATAGHCVTAKGLANVKFVFGFRMVNATTPPPSIVSNDEIFSGVAVLGRQEIGTGADWALVRLDRPATNHRVIPIRRAGKIANNQAVHVIGHPVGLPTKIAGGANVRTNTNSAFFVANLDTYGGNSGSPVFNAGTHEAEGTLVRGETDFVSTGTCNVSKVCPSNGCRGEDSTRTTVFSPILDGTTNQAKLLRRGSRGVEVAEWQGHLNLVRSTIIEVDGIFGQETDAATRAFQSDSGLSADGIVGPKTRAAMAAALP